ncbi:MAG: hypothetical protein OEY23_25775, partial [Acidimicrobiia bacterium]|nr:hypothetical protein [Acidimicrobiia bacterium]
MLAPWAAVASLGALRWLNRDVRHDAVLITFALPHRAGDDAARSHWLTLEAWRRATASQSRAWREIRRRYGVRYTADMLEHTYSERNGVHAHVHALWMTDQPITAEDAEGLHASLWRALAVELEALDAGDLVRRWSPERGLDLTPVHSPEQAAAYLGKYAVGSELADTGHKGDDLRTPLYGVPALIGELVGDHDPRDTRRRDVQRLVAAWDEYSAAVVGDDRRWRYRSKNWARDLVPEFDPRRPWAEMVVQLTTSLRKELGGPEPEPAGVPASDGCGPFDDEGVDTEPDELEPDGTLVVSGEAFRRARLAWRGRWYCDRTGRIPRARGRLLYAITGGNRHRPPPLELAVAWLAEDNGLRFAACFVAELGD